MNIQHLKYALAVERAGSISQAAQDLYMGQPNLSKAIKELEQTLNITIFGRTSKGVEITPKGREFLRHAKAMLQQYEQMEALGRTGDAQEQSLRISVPRSSYIVDAFTTFLGRMDLHQSIQMDFMETNALRAIRHVADGRSHFGIIRSKSDYTETFISMLEDCDLSWRTVLKFQYLLLMAPTHPLAGPPQTGISIEALAPYIEIVHGDTALPQMPGHVTETERGQTPGNKKILVYERGSQFDLLARVPGTYMWVSPLPEDLLKRNGLVQRQCGAGPAFQDILIYPKGRSFRPLESLFLRDLDDTVREILETSPSQQESQERGAHR